MKTAELFPPIPADTVRTARAIFGTSNSYILTGDQANRLFHGLLLLDPSKRVQVPPRTMAELYLITVFQYLETLPDGQAVDAVRERRDWKYALHLPLNISGFQPTMFCEFRKILLFDPPSLQTLQTLLARLADLGALNGGHRYLDARQVILRVCFLSRLAAMWEAMCQALETLAIRRADWLRGVSQPHWYERYSDPQGKLDLRAEDPGLEKQAQALGNDVYHLLQAVSGQKGLQDLPEVTALKQVWEDKYERVEGKVLWRKDTCANCYAMSRIWDPARQLN